MNFIVLVFIAFGVYHICEVLDTLVTKGVI
jgi:hypothetical protein